MFGFESLVLHQCGCLANGKHTAFQAGNRSSILLTRSNAAVVLMARRLLGKEEIDSSNLSGSYAILINMKHSEMLGMSLSKANSRLKKAIFLDLIKSAKRDSCFRCNKKIETPDELSVDHKIPWRYESADLFWDLDNIEFSHRKCNKKDRPHLGRKIISPKGMAWCYEHKLHLSLNLFTDSGVAHHVCKECRVKRNRKRYPAWKKSKEYPMFLEYKRKWYARKKASIPS